LTLPHPRLCIIHVTSTIMRIMVTDLSSSSSMSELAGCIVVVVDPITAEEAVSSSQICRHHY